MNPLPQAGETWFADFGMAGKPRWTFIVASQPDACLAVISVVLITSQFEGTPYEITLPRVSWLREQSYINAQSIQPVRRTEFLRKAPGKFDEQILTEVQAALKRWLKLK